MSSVALQIPNPISSAIDLGKTLIERLVPDKEKQTELKMNLLEMQEKGELDQLEGQLQTNIAEAQSRSWWVAGWRPAVGWILAAGLAYGLILQPFIVMFLVVFHSNFDAAKLPVLDWKTIIGLLTSLLGLSTLRSIDKAQGTDNGH